MIEDDYAESVEDLVFSVVLAVCAAVALVLMCVWVWGRLKADSATNEKDLWEWESGSPPLPPYEEAGEN